jgi:uncharacterized phage protein (TIGR01671 family)
MAREIKFRAWRAVEMLYQEQEGTAHTAALFNRIYKQHPVMQFTGLKDKRNTEIYEDDILELEGKYTYKVVYEDAKFVLYHVKTHALIGTKWGDLHRMFDPDFHRYDFKVIGNIYENPDLISEKVS